METQVKAKFISVKPSLTLRGNLSPLIAVKLTCIL